MRRYLGSSPAWCTPTPRKQQLPQLGAGPLRPIVLVQFLDQPGLLAVAEDLLALDLLGHGPAFVAIEAEDQGRRHPRVGVALGHLFELLGEQRIADPVVAQGHAAFFAADQFQNRWWLCRSQWMKSMALPTVAESKSKPHVRRQQAQGHLPDDAAFRIVEAVELVHHHGRGVLEIELAVQQAIEEDFGHDHEHGGRRGFRGGCRSPGRRRWPEIPTATARSCISWNFCSVRAISGVV